MSIECSECEMDLRGGHLPDCSRANRRRAFSVPFEQIGEKPKKKPRKKKVKINP